MDATDTQKRAFLKFKDTIRQMGESNSMYQPFDKIPYDKTKKMSNEETQRDSYRDKHHREKVKTVVPRQVKMSNYKIHQVLLDSNDRDKTIYPNMNHFVLKAATHFRNAFGVRLLKSELLYHSLTPGNGVYLALNGYRLLVRNEKQDQIPLFARITPGINDFQCVTTNILDDPYTYILNPMEPRLLRFEMNLYESDNVLIKDNHFNLILHLAIFCYS